MSVTADTSHFEMSQLKASVPENMLAIFVTADASHLEISALKVRAIANIALVSVTADTSHSPIGPSALLGQSSAGEIVSVQS